MALVPIVAWWVAMMALLVLGAPLAARLVGSPVRGMGYAIPLALAVLTILDLWAGHLTLGLLWLVASVLGLGALAGLAWWDSRESVTRGALAEQAGVVTVAYVAYVTLRSGAPGVRPDGEQFLDYGLLMSILRAPSLPPEDMWFAGEPVQYYYGGHLVVAQLVELTGVPPRFAFHLAIASTLAVVVGASYELGATIARRNGGHRTLGGLAAAGVVGFGGHAAALPWLAQPLRPVQEVATAFVLPGTVAVFPLLEALEGTMHAHVLVAPFVLLAAGIAYRLFADPAAPLPVLAVAAGAVTAAALVTSTWAAPTVVGVVFLAVAFQRGDATQLPLGGDVSSRPPLTTRLLRAAGLSLAVAAIGVLLASPFVLGSGRVYNVGIVAPSDRSGIWPLVQIYGGLLVVFAGFLVTDLTRKHWTWLGAGLVAVGLFVVLPWNLGVLALLAPIVALALARLLGPKPDFATLLMVAGAGLVTLVEFVYVLTDGPGNRFNTVFKTSMHVWLFWGAAAGGVVGVLWPRWRGTLTAAGAKLQIDGLARPLAVLLVTGLILPSGAYGLAAIPDHYATADSLTVDGTATITARHPAEMAAITYLGDLKVGQPTMVSAPGDRKYRWSAAPAASLTGIPTVAGWSHEAQYRTPDAYWARVQAVDAFYTGDREQQVRFLHRYDVRFIYVGPTERQRYGQLPEFDAIPGVGVAFYNDAVTVYVVNTGDLPVPPDTAAIPSPAPNLQDRSR